MRIKTLEITGFKSFKERTLFHFDAEVTGIVGPNGCGKSNVVDAIRWAMGEQSAKHLRGGSMEDVIFNGSESYGPLGMAEVVLTFVNDGDAPPPYTECAEVSVGRRLFRSGESEYFINKQACRLMDVTDFFLGTGVGTRAYSIIEQGRVGQIVSSKPEDRRSLIEEAAGITKYKAKKRAALRKMEATEQNLLRVRDILGEIGRRMASLERQAKKAEKYKRLRGEMRDIDLWAASHRFFELSASRRLARSDAERLAGEQAAAEERLAAEEQAVAEMRDALSSREHELFEHEKALQEHENEQRLRQSQLEFLEKEAEALEARTAEHRSELERLASHQEELAREAEELRLSHEDGLSAERSLTDDVTSRERARAVCAEEVSRSRDALEDARAKLAQAHARHEGAKAELVGLERRRADLTARRDKAHAERGELMKQLHGIESHLGQQRERLAEARQLKLALEAERETLQQDLAQKRERVVELEASLIALRNELGDKRARQKSLLELQERFEGFGEGVRSVMRWRDAEEGTGVLGLVADAISAPEHLEPAVEAALGDRLHAVLIQDAARARRAIGLLAKERKGRCTFVPIDGLEDAPVAQSDLPRDERVVGRLSDHVQHDPAYAPVVRALLGDVLVVRDLDAALTLRSAVRARFVTLDGEVLDAAGTVTGGTRQGAAWGVLQKKREIKELGREIGRLSEEHGRADLELKRLTGEVQGLHAQLDSMRQDTHTKEITIVQGQKDVDRAEGELRRIGHRLEVLAREEHEIDEHLSAIASDAARAVARAEEDAALAVELEGRLPDLEARAFDARGRLEVVSAEVTELKVAAATLREKIEAVARSRKRNGEARDEAGSRVSKLESLIEGAADEIAIRAGKAEEAKRDIEHLSGQAVTARAGVEAASRVLEEARSALLEREAGLRGHRDAIASCVESLHDARGRDSQTGLELGHLQQQVADKWGEDLRLHVVDYHAREALSPADVERLGELRAQIDRLGEVNVTAIQEFDELKERQEFLSTQERDLTDALEQLRRAIQKINRTSRERFSETFAAVNAKFQEVFPRLFRGGRAELQLVGAEDMLEAGVEIVAQPPGKKLANINQMSGGEKALTAVALIFAIFLVKPSPFCMLDEVDAPLDDANVGKFNELVRQMAVHSQFILITHNKRTMEITESLYGVTMEEPGVSKLVSVELRRKAAAA
jgi:chromosome segregation protein